MSQTCPVFVPGAEQSEGWLWLRRSHPPTDASIDCTMLLPTGLCFSSMPTVTLDRLPSCAFAREGGRTSSTTSVSTCGTTSVPFTCPPLLVQITIARSTPAATKTRLAQIMMIKTKGDGPGPPLDDEGDWKGSLVGGVVDGVGFAVVALGPGDGVDDGGDDGGGGGGGGDGGGPAELHTSAPSLAASAHVPEHALEVRPGVLPSVEFGELS